MEEIQQTLKALGLNDKEVSLYVTSLQLGESGITALAKKAGLKKTTAYLIFKSLESHGLMGSFKMKSGMKFVATKPEVLLSKTEKQFNDLKRVIPELRAIANQAENKPKITFFEGKEGYLTAIEDTLKKPGITIRHIGSLTELHQIVGEKYDLEYYVPTRIKKNIFFKALYTEDTNSKLKNLNHQSQLREMRFLPKEYKLKTSVITYENKIIVTSSQKDLMTIVIESEEIASDEQAKFDLIWNLLT